MQTLEFTIGRDGDIADIVPEGDKLITVSRKHAHVRMDIEKALFRVEDLDSSNGLFVMHHGEWERIHKGLLEPNVPVRFGFLETSFAKLLPQIEDFLERSQSAGAPARPADSAQQAGADGYHPRRNPETGEIID